MPFYPPPGDLRIGVVVASDDPAFCDQMWIVQ
jgi:hypothetical protein